MDGKFLLIDGNSLINRAYYAFGSGGGLTWNGAPTNATYGFLNMFIKAVTDIGAAHAAVAFDVREKTFRHKMFDGYKAGRKGMPDELAVQLSDLKVLLGIMKVAVLECPGYEADDIIGTLSKQCGKRLKGVQEDKHVKTVILSADRDGLQLIDECTELHLTKTGVTHLEVWDFETVRREYGITPAQMIDLKALMGDKSDCIPGASGVGEKTALSLMQQFGSIEEIYKNLDKVKDSLRERLLTSEKTVYLSRDLARIKTDVPVKYDFSDFAFPYPMDRAVYDAFDARGFKSFCKRPALWKEDYYSSVPQSESSGGGETSLGDAASEAENAGVNTPTGPVQMITVADLREISKIGGERLAVSYDNDAYYIQSGDSGGSYEHKIPLKTDLLSVGFDEISVIKALKSLFESSIPKAVFDSKTFKEKLWGFGIKLENVEVDIRICEHLLTTRTVIEPRKVTLEDFGYLKKLEQAGMLALYRDTELPLVDVLLGMQRNGAKIDLEMLNKTSDKLKAQIEELARQIFVFAGSEFNINSPQQLGSVLFDKLGIQTTRKTKTGYSTDEAELTKKVKAHPIVQYILRYRKVFKLYSTYIQGFRAQADENGFVHSTFNNTGTVTGRLSSSEPNLQNIPARSDDSELIRKLFTSRFPNGKIITADYSQIELRLLAHFSKDESLNAAFGNGRDIHSETALKVFSAVNPETRRRAKAINFGIVYGISAFGLSESIGCSVSEAAQFIEKYFAQFPSVKAYLDKCRDFAIMNGYAVTLFGRRRYLPELNSTNQNTVQFGARAAVNMPMQGSASDIIKKAMVKLYAKLNGTHLSDCLMIAQVHDELVFDCPPDKIQSAVEVIKQTMEDTVKISVPLTVEISVKETL